MARHQRTCFEHKGSGHSPEKYKVCNIEGPLPNQSVGTNTLLPKSGCGRGKLIKYLNGSRRQISKSQSHRNQSCHGIVRSLRDARMASGSDKRKPVDSKGNILWIAPEILEG